MIELIKYSFFPQDVLAFTTTRALARDKQRLSALISIDESRIVMPHQVHSDHILQITPDFLSLSLEEQKEQLEGVDALYTALKGVCIGVSTADCVPILLYDREEKIIASVHAGWRGTVKRVVQKTLARMATLGSRAENILAVIGPSISCKHYEVGDEVYDAFRSAGFPMEKIAERCGKWHINLSRCNALQLVDSGVKAENIYCDGRCTYASADLLFSARREQTSEKKCGRNFNALLQV